VEILQPKALVMPEPI